MKKNFLVISSLVLLSILAAVGCMKKANINDTVNSRHGQNVVQPFTSGAAVTIDPEILNAANAHNTYLQNSFNSLSQQPIFDFPVGVNVLKNNLYYFQDYPELPQVLNAVGNIATPQEAKDKVQQNKVAFRSNPFFDNFYSEIEQLANNASNSAEFSNFVSEYYASQYNNCPQQYLSMFKNACGVAMGSYEYWNLNYENWEEITKYHVQNGSNGSPAAAKQTKKEKIRDFVLADMTGSIFGVPGAAIASGLVAWAWD